MAEGIKEPDKSIAEFAPEKVKVLVFDIDDTVTRGTLGIKVDTWRELFADRLDQLQEARELYEFTGKGDRYNIIAHTIGEPQEDCQTNPKVEEWAKRFETTSMENIRKNGIHPEDVTALVALREKFTGSIHLLSATPQASVDGNVAHFQTMHPEIADMFAGIKGNPMQGGKAGELELIAKEHGVAIDEVLMIGDGGSDYNGATGSGSQFVGIIPPGKADKWSEENFPRLSSIAELPDLLGV